MSLLLAADVGTSGVKVIACDAAGDILASATENYPLLQPQPGWTEQDPVEWWAATVRAIRACLGSLEGVGRSVSEIAAVGLSGQMHGSVLLDGTAPESMGRAEPLRNALLWNDQRTAAQCERIESALGGREACVRLTGNAPLTGFTLPKLLWVREHEPEIWTRVRHVLLPKDFVRFRLTGDLATDVGDASGTLLFDIDTRRWSEQLARRFDIDPGLLPRVYESGGVVGRVSDWAADETGLRAGTPVIAGSGDNQCGAVGAGVVEPGLVLASLGTSGVIYAHASAPRRDLPPSPAPAGRIQAGCAGDGSAQTRGEWCNTGCMLSAAGAVAWCREVIAPEMSFEALLSLGASAPPGCEGLVFLPYLTGERCPHPDPHARGAWIGLTSRHTRAHLVRAVVEGVTFGMGQMLDLVRAMGVPVRGVRLTGGGNRAAWWRQLQADVYGVPVVSTNSEEGGAALGAAIMAGVGAGLWPNVRDACRAVVRPTETLHPDPQASEHYGEARERYARMYPAIRGEVQA